MIISLILSASLNPDTHAWWLSAAPLATTTRGTLGCPNTSNAPIARLSCVRGERLRGRDEGGGGARTRLCMLALYSHRVDAFPALEEVCVSYKHKNTE